MELMELIVNVSTFLFLLSIPVIFVGLCVFVALYFAVYNK